MVTEWASSLQQQVSLCCPLECVLKSLHVQLFLWAPEDRSPEFISHPHLPRVSSVQPRAGGQASDMVAFVESVQHLHKLISIEGCLSQDVWKSPV